MYRSLVLLCAAAWLCVSAQAVLVDHRVLFITVGSSSTTGDFLKLALDGYGVPFTVLDVSAQPSLDYNTFLFKAPGQGRFSAIVMMPSVDALGFMTGAQVRTLEGYCATFGVRVVRFGAWPSYYGFTPVPTAACTSAEQGMVFTSTAPLGVSGIKQGARLSSSGLYRCAGVIPASSTTCGIAANDFTATGIFQNCTSTPFLTFEAAPGINPALAQPTMAGALVSYGDGREAMVYTFDCAAWQTSCMVLGHVAISWMLHGVINGERRAMLSTQVDDLFLETVLRDDVVPIYRATPADLQAHLGWKASVNSALPPGSSFTVEMAWNGNGALLAYRAPEALDIGSGSCDGDPQYVALGCNCFNKLQADCTSPAEFCRQCSKDFKMPLGSGADLIPANYTSASWNAAAIRAGDPLAALTFSNPSLVTGLNWISHTFTHQNLNNATQADSSRQWQFNKDMEPILGITADKGMAQRMVVTPQISGLTNGNNWQAMAGVGYVAAVGDNTWAYLRNQERPHQTLTTDSGRFGWSGGRIVPRWATEVYFAVATERGEVSLYNFLYRSFFGADSTFQQILDREAIRVFRDGILSLRRDPHMFHQANLATINGKSLLMRWVEAVLGTHTLFTNWPIETLNSDRLLDAFLAREQRDACNLQYTLDVDVAAKAVRTITIASTGGSGSCSAPLLIPDAGSVSGSSVTAPSSAGSKQLGVQLSAGGSVSLTASGLAW